MPGAGLITQSTLHIAYGSVSQVIPTGVLALPQPFSLLFWGLNSPEEILNLGVLLSIARYLVGLSSMAHTLYTMPLLLSANIW